MANEATKTKKESDFFPSFSGYIYIRGTSSAMRGARYGACDTRCSRRRAAAAQIAACASARNRNRIACALVWDREGYQVQKWNATL